MVSYKFVEKDLFLGQIERSKLQRLDVNLTVI